MTDLTDKQRAEKMRQVADLLEALGSGSSADMWRLSAERIDPPDPYAGLDDDQWVEVEPRGHGNGAVVSVKVARAHDRNVWALARVVPDGDARTHVVIEDCDIQEALEDDRECAPRELLEAALGEHERRWSS